MRLHYSTVVKELKLYLDRLMNHPAFGAYYLAGGTALSLQLGHRMSADIDLFTDKPYGSVNFALIKEALLELFPHIRNIQTLDSDSMVQTVYVGDDEESEIKLDLCYDELRIDELLMVDKLRIASVKEIGAMKMNAILTGERRKDYWDIHEMMQTHDLEVLIDWGLQKYPYSLTRNEILEKLSRVWNLDDKTDVISLKGGEWEFVADDLCYEATSLLNPGGEHE